MSPGKEKEKKTVPIVASPLKTVRFLFIYFFTLTIFVCLTIDGEPKSLHQEEIKANICGIMDREINSLSSKLVVWVPLNVTSMHVPDR